MSRLCQGVSLKELAQAIADNKVLYVWIDRVALPQQSCKLQQTLLARYDRMMPVAENSSSWPRSCHGQVGCLYEYPLGL